MKKAIVMAAAVALISCKKENEISFSTIDESSNPVGNTTVKIYRSYDGWLSGMNEDYSFVADANGKVETNKKISTGTYWVWAEKDDYSSWIGPVSSETVPQFTVEKGEAISANITMNENYHTDLVDTKWELSDYTNSDGNSLWSIMSDCFKDDYIEISREMDFYMNSGDNICAGYSQTADLDLKTKKVTSDEVTLEYYGPCYKINNTIYTDADGFDWNIYLQTENVTTPRIILSYDTTASLNFIYEKAY